MKILSRFARKFRDGMRTLWGCQANIFVKIAAIPVMVLIALMCCTLDIIDGEAE